MIDWPLYDIGSHRLSCPACGRNERDKTLGLTVEPDGAGVAHCFRCDLSENYRPDRGARLVMPAQPRIKGTTVQRHESLSEFGRELWAACRPLAGAAVEYLQARRCVLPPADGDLRYHPSLKHPCGHTGPALVALITDAVTCQPLSLHRTWIRAAGRKADIEKPRLLLGGHKKDGGVIRLWPDEAVTTGLGIAEGIETALSLAHAFQPVWSCIDAGNLGKFPVLPGVESLVIAVDDDEAGRRAAEVVGPLWALCDREVKLVEARHAK